MEGKDCLRPLGKKSYNELGKTVSLMLRMCRPIFGSWKSVLFESEFCVTKGIIEFEAKSVNAASLFQKRSYWSKKAPGDLIGTNFEGKEVGDVGIIEARNEDNKLFKIFCMKDMDYVITIMASWMTLHELEGARTRTDFIDSSRTKNTKHPK